MKHTIAHVALVVRDYDEAIDYYTRVLGFTLIEDTFQPEQDKRWVVVAPAGSTGTTLLLARAATPEQSGFIGNQAGGRVFLFLRTDDFWRDYNRMSAAGVRFVRPPTVESYGTVAVFEDLYGNRWDLVEYARTGMDTPPTCGQGLAAHAPLPEELGQLVAATAAVLEAHLGMLDLSDPLSVREDAVYRELIAEHRRAAEVLGGVARRMAAARDLPMGGHLDAPEANVTMGKAFAHFVEREEVLHATLETRLADDRGMLRAMTGRVPPR